MDTVSPSPLTGEGRGEGVKDGGINIDGISFRLLLGFYQPQQGSIKLDGRDIRHLASNELRANFGVVPQETILLSGAIYANLILVKRWENQTMRNNSRSDEMKHKDSGCDFARPDPEVWSRQ